MAKYYGYCYDGLGEFTEIIPLGEKAITEEQPEKYFEDEIVKVEEKLCEKHMDGDAEDGTTKEDCEDCILEHTETIQVEKTRMVTVVIGYEPDVPENCTLEICPDGIYYPKFVDGKWVKTVEPKPEEPKPEEPSELEKLKKQQELMQQALDEIIINNPGKEEFKALSEQQTLIQKALDELIISSI